ncbi:hypothetical protein [Bacillus smithii]|uniref:hypothetical protein n=1 Tax=Bacillus smithii TaxID=1479 RepID=UPI002E240FE2|nr:hypothetical protein [Bacillus smithii]MED1456666.1 hypothetical protein [Bacillus smithii]
MTIVGLTIQDGDIIFAGDTRLINPSKIPNEVASRFDFAIKIFKVTDNILIGIADDYSKKTMELIKKIKKELNKTDIKGDFYWSYNHNFVARKISNIVKSSSVTSQDLLMAIHDMRYNKRYAYKFLQILNHEPHKIEENGFIGLNPEYHDVIIKNYQKAIEKNNPHNIVDYANSFLESFKSVRDVTVNSFPICYVMHDHGIMTISNGTGFIGENGNVNWVVNTIDENGKWVRKVNNKIIGYIISDVDVINHSLGTSYK